MTTTIEAMKQAVDALEWHTHQTRPIDRTDKALSSLREAIAAEEAQGVEPCSVIYQIKLHIDSEATWRDASYGAYQLTPDSSRRITYTRPAPPPSNTEFLAGKLELMTAERDKMQLELGDLRALRARRPAHDNPTQIGGPDDWAIAGIEVKIGDGRPNFHLYRLLAANELKPGVYELFTRPSQPPAGEREALINELKSTNLYYQHGKAIGLAKRAADMLAADHVEHPLNMVPMTDQELDDLLPTNDSMSRKDSQRWIARATERHHKIGVKP